MVGLIGEFLFVIAIFCSHNNKISGVFEMKVHFACLGFRIYL